MRGSNIVMLAALGAGIFMVAIASAATIRGTDRAEILRGTPRSDEIYGRGGNDKLFGYAGNDRFYPGPGADTVICGPGLDRVFADTRDKTSRDCEIVTRPRSQTGPPGATNPMSFSDEFQRPFLGPDWKVFFGTPGIVGGREIGLPSGSIGGVQWAAPIPPDQFSEARISAGIAKTMQKQVFVRRRTSDAARYAFHYNLGVIPHRWEIKYDGVPTSQTRLLATAETSPGPAPGDVLRLEARGKAIRGYLNGTLILSATDSAIPAGAPGMAFVLIGASVSKPEPVFERWTGGKLLPP